ncbi:hypothetical protein [Methylobacterium nodulans]|uniref:Translation initiation factor IF-2 n=1 Tax=Methylobacterium nodulans (strain LMG 21967 / CNCM I-2342 / ORS 2060) TaxID=460265 RepID=B8IAT5_METNO|nr:hypothetical protein [Methylobacterium nodulans]ACL61130.1 conserved hypothetical protein [Methylobacterium nodulans ORS 2060]
MKSLVLGLAATIALSAATGAHAALTIASADPGPSAETAAPPPAAPPPAPEAESAPEPPPAARPAPRRRAAAPAAKPAGYRSARYGGGHGATWKTGKNAYGFEGTFGGCRFVGSSGPGGYKLDRSC